MELIDCFYGRDYSYMDEIYIQHSDSLKLLEPFFIRLLKNYENYDHYSPELNIAVRALIVLRSTVAIDAMIDVYEHRFESVNHDYDFETDVSYSLRKSIIEYFRGIMDERTIPTLFKAVKEPPDYIAIRALATLVNMLGERMIPYLKGVHYEIIYLVDFVYREELKKFVENALANFNALPKNDYQIAAEYLILDSFTGDNLSDKLLEDFKKRYSLEDVSILFFEIVKASVNWDDKILQEQGNLGNFDIYDNTVYILFFYGIEKKLEFIKEKTDEIQERNEKEYAKKLLEIIEIKINENNE